MFSFLQYLEEASKFRVTSEKSTSSQINNALEHPHHDSREMAVRDIHPERHKDHEQLFTKAAADKNSWVRRGVAKHPHTPESILKDLAANDPHERVRSEASANLEQRKSGGDKAGAEKPQKVKQKAIPTVKKSKAEKPAEAPKAEKKPKAQKPSGELSIVKGDPADHPYAKEVHHVVDSKGRKLGTVIRSSIPHEVGPDKEKIDTYTGDQDKTGLAPHKQGHKSVPHALLSLVNHLKGKE